jgi:predicted thioesterase
MADINWNKLKPQFDWDRAEARLADKMQAAHQHIQKVNMKTAKITACTFVREWTGATGTIYYHDITLDNGDSGSVGTKEKNSAKIAVGETVTYNIEEKEFNGRKSYNIKLTAPAPTFTKGGGGYSNPGNQQEIRKSVALNNAVQFWKDQKGAKIPDVLVSAEVFLKWLEGAVQTKVDDGGGQDEEMPF